MKKKRREQQEKRKEVPTEEKEDIRARIQQNKREWRSKRGEDRRNSRKRGAEMKKRF